MDLERLSDDDLTTSLRAAVKNERRSLSTVLEHLIEFGRRDLAVRKSFPSLFAYCVKALRYSEAEAAKRVHASKLAKRFPSILRLLDSGRITLTTLTILGPHLTSTNHRHVLYHARGKSKRELELMAVALAPKPEPSREVIRALPAAALSRPGAPCPAAAFSLEFETGAELGAAAVSAGPILNCEPPQKIEPLTPRRIRFAFTAGERFLAMFERARGLLKHKHPAGRLEEILEEALAFLLSRRDPALKNRPARPRPSDGLKRRVPQWVKDAVHRRDGGRCAYAADGRRCEQTAGLEYDHVRPWALGGLSNDPGNVRLLCRAHNQLAARKALGTEVMNRWAA